MNKVVSLLSVIGSACSLAGCGGGGSSSSSDSQTPAPAAQAPAPPVVAKNQSVGGIWTSQYTVSSGANAGDVVTEKALVTEDGEFYLFGLNNTNGCADVGFGQASTSGSTVTGTADWAIVTYTTSASVNATCTEPDGSTDGTAALSGTVTSHSALSLTDVDTTSAGTVLPAVDTTWTYNTLYSQPASLTTLAGNYSDNGATLSITASGAITEQDGGGCVLNGQVSVPNTAYNAYSFTASYANCSGSNADLNGASITGLGTLDTTQTPNVLDVGMRATVNGRLVVLILIMPRQ